MRKLEFFQKPLLPNFAAYNLNTHNYEKNEVLPNDMANDSIFF